MLKIFLILFALILPALAYPALDDLPTEIVQMASLSQNYPFGGARENFTAIIEKDSPFKTMGSVRYGYGNYSPIKADAGWLQAFVMGLIDNA